MTFYDISVLSIGLCSDCYAKYLTSLPTVTGSTDDGMLEGVLRGVTGVFPPHCVQEVRLRNPQAVRESLIAPQVARVQGRREMVPPHYGTAPRIRKP